MRVSPAGRAAIRQREGCRLTAYRDSVGVLTIGVGHTGRMAGPPVHAGMQITMAQADAFLAADLAPVEDAIASAVKVPLTQNQCDALASLAFNIGTGGFKKSTVVSRLNKRDYAGAADAFMLWCKPSALTSRRRGERLEFLTPDTTTKPPIHPDIVVEAAKAVAAHPAATAAPAAATPAPSKPGLLARLAFFFGRH